MAKTIARKATEPADLYGKDNPTEAIVERDNAHRWVLLTNVSGGLAHDMAVFKTKREAMRAFDAVPARGER